MAVNISVVIPLYNKAEYIGRAIESVLRQTVQPTDIVVVDDGSTDNSANEVLKFNDNRLRLVWQKNAGVGAARNRGVAETKYELVAFLDADDEWKPDFLLHIRRLYNNFPDCGAYATSYEMTDPYGNKSYPFLEGLPPAPWIGIFPYFFQIAQQCAPFMPSCVAIPKPVYRDLNGFPEGIKQGEDRMLWVRLGIKYPIAFSPASQAKYYLGVPNSALSARMENYSVTANLIDEILGNHEAPQALVNDLQDYSAYLKIMRGYHLILNGRNQEARDLLASIGPNRKYRKTKLWWQIWALMPYSLVNYMRKLNSWKRSL